MDFKIKTLNAISPAIYGQLNEHYRVSDAEEAPAAILVRSAKMHDMPLPDSVLAIARAGAGVNNIPIDACSAAGICVFNTPGANANAVSELVIAGLLLSCRDVIGGIEWERTLSGHGDAIEKEVEKGKNAFVGPELRGKTLGVIGLGAIGVLVANAAIALGMKVLGFDPYMSVNAAWKLSPAVRHAETVEAIYAESDFVTIHVPATPATKGMISAEAIAKMKDGAVLLNFARDALVDEAAVARALETGKLARYVTDFPNPVSAAMDKAIVIPHLGASTEEAEDNCAVMAVDELQDYLDNGNIRNSVNYPEVNMGVCETAARVAILHRNIPNMLSQITAFFGSQGLNIENMANKSRGSYAYTLLDLTEAMPRDTVQRLKAIEGVLRVRRVTEK